jgi:NAD(P)-dependent dehydrogenase (short-subunit alcohol dehydrogenase family)
MVVVDIDLNGTFNVVRAGFQHLAAGASIINITAPQSTVAMRYQAHVSAAKAGVDQLTRVLALEWGVHNIRVNAICRPIAIHRRCPLGGAVVIMCTSPIRRLWVRVPVR